MRYTWNDLFTFDFKAFYEWIISKRPSLEGKPFNVYTDDKYVKVLHFNQNVDQVMKQHKYDK